MLGKSWSSLEVNDALRATKGQLGIQGDRQFAIRDRQGKFGSGKNTRRFRKIDGLFAFRAIDRQGIPEIQFPDGQRILGNHPDIHQMLSETLGQSVTLSPEEEISHLDAGPIHLITTAALQSLRQTCLMATIGTRRCSPPVTYGDDRCLTLPPSCNPLSSFSHPLDPLSLL